MDEVQNGRYGTCDEWTRRAFVSDARAITRGDVLPNDANGATTFPRYMSRAQGAYVWDVDGNRYVDFLLGYGPVILGHAHPGITQAVAKELGDGHCIAPLWSTRQVQLSELIRSVIPGAERTLLLKTGSDATSAAVRVARIHTGRDKVVRWGYNGWHDWSVEQSSGVPSSTRAQTLLFEYGDPGSLRDLFRDYPTQVACVLMMPFEYETTTASYLAEIRLIAHEHGALFILDEMRSGFRMALGGAQEFFSVQADLVCLGKAMANGYSISALTGRADVLNCLSRTKVSSTYFANPADMVAALTTIQIVRDTDALHRVWALGSLLQEGLRVLVEEAQVPAEVVGYPPMPFLRFLLSDPDTQLEMIRTFFTETTRRGVLLHPNHQWFLSAAHTEADIEFTLDACRQALAVTTAQLDLTTAPLRRAVASNSSDSLIDESERDGSSARPPIVRNQG